MSEGIKDLLSRHTRLDSGSLIPLLQDVQEKYGYLSQQNIQEVSDYLSIPSSKIYCIATFYNQFRFSPKGRYHIRVCRGTACHINGSLSVLNELEKMLDIKDGQTTRDGLFSLEVSTCMGACSLAPVIAINGDYFEKINADMLKSIIDEYRKK